MGAAHLRTLVDDSLWQDWAAYFCSPSCPLTLDIFLKLSKVILSLDKNWFQCGSVSSIRHKCSQIADAAQKKDMTPWLVLGTCRYLSFLGLGKFVSSAPCSGGGKPVWYYLRRPLGQQDMASLEDLLPAFGVTAASTPSLEAYKARSQKSEDSPQRAPQLSDWTPLEKSVVLDRASARQVPSAQDRG